MKLGKGQILEIYATISWRTATLIISKTIKITIYKIIILPEVLYAYETLPLTFREAPENTVLRGICGCKKGG
jgi:hypothetical protein